MRTLIGLLLLASLAVVVPGCAAQAEAKPVATSHVEMPPSYRFSPTVIEVPVGTAVTWHNSDNFTHSVRLLDGSGVNDVARPGQSVSITFTKIGTYKYDCAFHPHDMSGEVIVTP